MIGILLILVFIVVAISEARSMARGVKQEPVVPKEIVKNCPPHKWHYTEVKDKEGNVSNGKIACALCGPLKPMGIE